MYRVLYQSDFRVESVGLRQDDDAPTCIDLGKDSIANLYVH